MAEDGRTGRGQGPQGSAGICVSTAQGKTAQSPLESGASGARRGSGPRPHREWVRVRASPGKSKESSGPARTGEDDVFALLIPPEELIQALSLLSF